MVYENVQELVALKLKFFSIKYENIVQAILMHFTYRETVYLYGLLKRARVPHLDT